MRTFRWITRLFIIHSLFILLVAEGMYFHGLDLVMSIIYLIILWQAGALIASEFEVSPMRHLFIIGLAYQIPGYFMTSLNLLYYNGIAGIAPDITYGFQLWHTPMLPLFSIHSFPALNDFTSYFVALFFLSPFYLLVLNLPFLVRRIKTRPVNGKGWGR